jgi:hypothetical protein
MRAPSLDRASSTKDALGRSTTSSRATEQIQQLVIARAISGLRIE